MDQFQLMRIYEGNDICDYCGKPILANTPYVFCYCGDSTGAEVCKLHCMCDAQLDHACKCGKYIHLR